LKCPFPKQAFTFFDCESPIWIKWIALISGGKISETDRHQKVKGQNQDGGNYLISFFTFVFHILKGIKALNVYLCAFPIPF